MTRVTTGLVVMALLIGACGDDSTTSSTTTTSPPTTTTTIAPTTTLAPTTTTTVAPTTTTVAENAVLCDAFLAFRGAQEPDTMQSALATMADELGEEAPDTVAAAIVAFQTADFGDTPVGEWIGYLRDNIIPMCMNRYYEGVVGTADNATTSQQFFDALVAGDRATAATLAQAEVIAQFEPWEAIPGTSAIEETSSGGFAAQLGFGYGIACVVTDGIVVQCGRTG